MGSRPRSTSTRATLAGLVVAEVEFGSERQSRDFRPPAWLGEEVTGDRRYANQSLALGGDPLFGPLPGDEAWGPPRAAPIA